MADTQIPNQGKTANAEAGAAYWDGVLVLEDLGNSLERLKETAYALATSEVFEERAQHAFYSLGDLALMLEERATSEEERFTRLSGKDSPEREATNG